MKKRIAAVTSSYRLLNQKNHASNRILHHHRRFNANFNQVIRSSSTSEARFSSQGVTHHCGPVPLKHFLASCRWDLQKSSLIHMQNMPIIQQRNFGSVASTIVQRNPLFSTINHDDIIYFEKILGVKNVIQDDEELQPANTDWMHKYKGSSKLMLQPENTDELSQILKYCNSRCLAVVPQGGNTGLVGGSVPVFDEVIINTRRMNRIISFDKVSGVLVCDAGCILENLISFLDKQGFIMPLDLGAKGSCQIGGNVSTNAGGLRLVRYGSLHGTVLGLEVVLANGNVIDMLGTLRKDNTGYDLKHLFIGSEGSLGIITKVSILTPAKLSAVNIAFLACQDYISCQKLLFQAKRRLGEILSAFEFLDAQAMNLVLQHLDGVRNPLPSAIYNFYVLIETTGSNESSDKEKLEAFLLHAMENGLVSDGALAQDMNQASSFWHIREGVPEALMKAGAVYKYDLSLPVEKMYDLVEEIRIRLGAAANVVGYGHLGDGNLHLNVSTPQYDDTILAQIEPFVYEWTSRHHGSISAEHGLGLMKAEKIYYSKSSGTVQLMASIKKLLDPSGILNPYKVIPPSLLS
ncbi:D-2-hydroxyglutarate dehydrogenase, mitochondrial isoform X3 [Cynara cardunculus var. scolymus]|uniref:D-2-hydroxyglutarate dehydrogenase, mitochondrial isoform X3 n=1 Tax=Cynara cardunculus var. scolymus TaxID=59895 RepID=UPI000D62C382|nr:D-2-hydroxyglutarate dehydrogenase, mitochondrial isoform X3 [Cynara cardunculus var. scolymus]